MTPQAYTRTQRRFLLSQVQPVPRIRKSLVGAVLLVAGCSGADSARSASVAIDSGRVQQSRNATVTVDANARTAIHQFDSCGTPGAPDTLTFNNLVTAPISDDVSGHEVRFFRDSASEWQGVGGEAFGELAPLTPLTDLSSSPPEAKIRFGIQTLGPISRFIMRVSCDSLWGTLEPLASELSESVVLRRVRR